MRHYTLGCLAELAYQRAFDAENDASWEDSLRDGLPTFGYDVSTVAIKDDSEWYTCSDDNSMCIVARGTDHFFDWFRNLAIIGLARSIALILAGRLPTMPTTNGPYAHQVHAGFWRSVQDLYPHVEPDIEEAIENKKGIYLVGHSKGAAEMRCLYALLIEKQVKVAGIVTFGEPPSLSPPLAGLMIQKSDLDVRYVNCRDIVPRSLVFSRLMRRIGHSGYMRYFDRKGVMRENPGWSWCFFDRVFAKFMKKPRGLTSDHSMRAYLGLLKSNRL